MKNIRIIFIGLIFLFSSLFFSTPTEAKSNIVNPNQVYTYKEMGRDIKKLEKKYPDLVQVKVIGKSEYGRKIYAFSVGKGSATVFINGSHHAREWLTTNLNMHMAEQYIQAYKSGKKINGYSARKILKSTTIWFVPMVNPDGVTLQQKGLSAFPKKDRPALIKMNNGSKNFKRWKANGKGVDLNRQYDAGWQQIISPSSPSFKNFKGTAPHSAAETKAVLKFVEQINPEMAVSYHSSGQILFWNYKQNKKDYKRDKVYAKKIGKMTGYSLVNPGKNPSGGGFTDWFISTKHRPAFTPEIAKYYSETSPPISEFSGAWRENKAVGLYVAWEGSKLFKKRVKSIEKEYSSLKKSAKKLKTYYYSNVKSTKDLKTSKKLTNLYNKVNKDLKKLDKKAKSLPTKSKKEINKTRKNIKSYLSYSMKYTTAINSGKDLLSLNKALKNDLQNIQSKETLEEKRNQLSLEILTTEAAISKMYGKGVRKYSTTKYIKPAQITLQTFDDILSEEKN